MEEEMDQIEKNETWERVPRPKNKNMIGTKCVFGNKLNEDEKLNRNKERLVCKGYARKKLFPSCKNGSSNTNIGLCMFEENKSISYGCKINLPKWRTRRRSVHIIARRVSIVRKGRICFHIKEGTIWTQKSPQRLVFNIG
jgi:hypothetical protein